MSFIERELEKVENAIRNTPNGDDAANLRVVQCALRWATDPDCYMSPSNYLNKFHGLNLPPTDGTGIITSDALSSSSPQ